MNNQIYLKNVESLKKSLESEATNFANKFMKRLCKNGSSNDFLDWLMKYDAFNRGFPGAAAELAGRITSMIDSFGDVESEMIASRVIAAITDEFLNRQTGEIALHSKLRRELVLFALGNLASKSRPEALVTVKTYDAFRKEILIATRKGYGLEGKDQFRGIFFGLGFFTASETSGASEFVTLNLYIDKYWSQLKTALKSQDDEQGRTLYSWISDHEDLEADHAGFAFNSIELALEYLKSDEERAIALEEVYQGVSSFFEMAELTLLS